VPTVRSLAEAKEAVKWAYFPPLGGRSQGGSSLAFWGGVPGGYRKTFNDNLVLTLMIETLDGLQDADKIAALPGVTALFAASGDLGNFGGYARVLQIMSVRSTLCMTRRSGRINGCAVRLPGSASPTTPASRVLVAPRAAIWLAPKPNCPMIF